MKKTLLLLSLLNIIFISTSLAEEIDEDTEKAYIVYEQMSEVLNGEWTLSVESAQEGTSSYKNPAISFLVGSKETAMSYKQIGTGSTLQEDLLPDTKKQMVTMYFCDKYYDCRELRATHYCAKQNNPKFILNEEETTSTKIVFDCNMDTPLCNSNDDHVHKIIHELSNNNTHLKSSYLGWKNQTPNKKNSIYHFDKK